MKKSKPLPSLTQLKNWATKKIKQGTTSLNNTFNNLSLKNQRIMVIAFGMTTGFVCVALIVHSVLTPLSLPLPFDKSQPLPTAPAPNMSDSLHLIPLGTLTGEMDGHQIALKSRHLNKWFFLSGTMSTIQQMPTVPKTHGNPSTPTN